MLESHLQIVTNITGSTREAMKSNGSTLAVVSGVPVAVAPGGYITHSSFGRVVDELGRRFDSLQLCVPVKSVPADHHDHTITTDVSVVPTPGVETAFRGVLNRRAAVKAYRQVVASADAVFVRGVLLPGMPLLYKEAARRDIPVCHWLVGDPMALLQSHRRQGVLLDALGKIFVARWERRLHQAHRLARAAYLCNGQAIAMRHPSERSYVVVSSTLTDDDFYERRDTCNESQIRVLCACFVRPEKGIEYLLHAFHKFVSQRNAVLVIAGSRDQYAKYQQQLDAISAQLDLGRRVVWRGHLSAKELSEEMRRSDIFAFPSLSEGTPRVLVEARANGLPIVSTDVGGITSSVTNGVDGLLVSPKDPSAMAGALERVASDGVLRRSLIANGYRSARRMTVSSFVDRVMMVYSDLQN